METLENPSQIILRQQRLLLDSIMLVCPKADSLALKLSEIKGDNSGISALCWDYSSYLLQSQDAKASFTIRPPQEWQPRQIIIFMPKSKDLLPFILAAIGQKITGAEKIWLVGEKREGIESAAKNLAKRVAGTEFLENDRQKGQSRTLKLDSARHCQLWEINVRDFATGDTDKYWRNMTWQISGIGNITISSLPGVFSFGRLDPGTKLLLDCLPNWGHLAGKASDRILDFGCGCGVIGFAVAKKYPRCQTEMVDTNLLALEGVKKSLSAEESSAIRVWPSNGLEQVEKGLSAIVTNPPFHQGIKQDLKTTHQFLSDCSRYLLKGGSLMLVANRFLPYGDWIETHVGQPQTLAEDSKYKVYQAVKR